MYETLQQGYTTHFYHDWGNNFDLIFNRGANNCVVICRSSTDSSLVTPVMTSMGTSVVTVKGPDIFLLYCHFVFLIPQGRFSIAVASPVVSPALKAALGGLWTCPVSDGFWLAWTVTVLQWVTLSVHFAMYAATASAYSLMSVLGGCLFDDQGSRFKVFYLSHA